MYILYIDLNRGSGISLLGELFLDLLRITSPITKIDVYSLQCMQEAKSFTPKNYDLVIINEFCLGSLEVLLEKLLKRNIKIINIQHSNPDYLFSSINFALNSKTNFLNNVYALDFLPGNIWYNMKLKRKGMLIVSRICESKINYELLSSLGVKPDVYGHIVDEQYFKKIKSLINYKGIVSSYELVNLYNKYSYLYVLSTTECLCIPIREALMCGCIPIVYDPLRKFTKNVSKYIYYLNEEPFELEKFDWNFETFYLQFIFGLRAVTLTDFKLNLNNTPLITFLHDTQSKIHYKYELLNKDLLWKNINKIG